jgi:hypothetical protein
LPAALVIALVYASARLERVTAPVAAADVRPERFALVEVFHRSAAGAVRPVDLPVV